MVVVARQDLVQDPPFLRLDLVSCRNVLIYLQNELQAKVLSTFHYSLNPNSLLFLGKSEGIFQQEALFEVLDKATRIYRRCAGESRLSVSAFRLPDSGERSIPKIVADSESRLMEEAAQNTFAVLFIDLDNFKVINDSLGHAAGDDLLKEIGSRLRECVRTSDTVARFGGDEFALLIEEATVAEAEMTAHRIGDAMLRQHSIGRQNIYPGASIGICLYPNDGLDPETLLKNADSAMYQAKDGGKRAHHFFTNELKQIADERLKLETELRGAIEREELFLLYQPQVDIASGRLVGVEALARWRHPTEGLIPPSKFIPLAEKSGIIDRLGEWVAATACKQMADWTKDGHGIPRVSINVSPYQFRRSNIPALMLRLLSQYHLDASRVMVELTESALAEDTEHAHQLLLELKALGIKLSIDDFGTGYSSLAYLRSMPIHELKIAQHFVTDIASNADAQAIARTILLMSQALGFSVVAEGIETAEQLEVLRAAGCDIGQGFLFAQPLSAKDLIKHFGNEVVV